MNKASKKTPVRLALQVNSALRPLVLDGLDAIENGHRNYFEIGIRADFADSLDLDKALQKGLEQANRWDYLLGHLPTGEVVAVEPHSAKQDEVSTVIKKRAAAREQLKNHLRDDIRVAKWLWVASGKVHFADTEKVRRLLDQNGIEFVGSRVTGKHLPSASLQKMPAKKAVHLKGK